MGGSGIVGDVVRSLFAARSHVPVEVVKGYVLPDAYRRDTLVRGRQLLREHRGDAVRLLPGRRRGVPGGRRLGAGARWRRWPRPTGCRTWRSPATSRCRGSGSDTSPARPIGVLAAMGLLPPVGDDLDRTVVRLEALAARLAPERPTAENLAKELAVWLAEPRPAGLVDAGSGRGRRPAMEDPVQREREGPGRPCHAPRAGSQRHRRAGRRGRPPVPRWSCSATATSTRGCPSASERPTRSSPARAWSTGRSASTRPPGWRRLFALIMLGRLHGHLPRPAARVRSDADPGPHQPEGAAAMSASGLLGVRPAGSGRHATPRRAWRSSASARRCVPAVAVVLGSGLGDAVAQDVEVEDEFAFQSLPGFPPPSVPGHAGRLALGHLYGVPVAVFRGRVHYYEGHGIGSTTLIPRLCAALGAGTLVLTNASGGLDESVERGTLMLIEDHLNFLGVNPLMGWRYPDGAPGLRRPVLAVRAGPGRGRRRGGPRAGRPPAARGVRGAFPGPPTRPGPRPGSWPRPARTRSGCRPCPRRSRRRRSGSASSGSRASPTWPGG